MRFFAFSLLFLLSGVGFLPSAGAAALSGSFTPLLPGTNINLTAEGKLDWIHWGFYGNVTWQAATLSSPPPAPVLVISEGLQPNVLDLSFLAQAGVNYTVWGSSSLNPANWQVLTNFSGSDATAAVNDSGTNFVTRFYRVQAQ